jgi:hypothetical protein
MYRRSQTRLWPRHEKPLGWKRPRYPRRSHNARLAAALAGMHNDTAVRRSLRTGATGPNFNDYRAGSATIASGTSSIAVTFSSAMPSTSYVVQLTITSTGAFSNSDSRLARLRPSALSLDRRGGVTREFDTRVWYSKGSESARNQSRRLTYRERSTSLRC